MQHKSAMVKGFLSTLWVYVRTDTDEIKGLKGYRTVRSLVLVLDLVFEDQIGLVEGTPAVYYFYVPNSLLVSVPTSVSVEGRCNRIFTFSVSFPDSLEWVWVLWGSGVWQTTTSVRVEKS